MLGLRRTWRAVGRTTRGASAGPALRLPASFSTVVAALGPAAAAAAVGVVPTAVTVGQRATISTTRAALRQPREAQPVTAAKPAPAKTHQAPPAQAPAAPARAQSPPADTSLASLERRQKQSAERPAVLAVGDLVEVRRSGKTQVGVIIHILDSGFTNFTTMLFNGHIAVHSKNDVFFSVPGWAYLPRIQRMPTDPTAAAGAVGISVESGRHLAAAGIPRSVTYHLAAFTSAVDSNLTHFTDEFLNLHLALLDRSSAQADNGSDAGSRDILVTPREAAQIVTRQADPSPSEIYAAYLHMCRSTTQFAAADSFNLLERPQFRVLSHEESKQVHWVIEQVQRFGRSPSNELPFGSFLAKVRRLVQEARATTSQTTSGNASAATTEPQNQPQDAALDIAFDDSDRVFIRTIIDSLGVAPNFPSHERSFAQTQVLKRLSPLYAFYPTEKDVLLFLKEIGVHAPWENPATLRISRKGRLSFVGNDAGKLIDARTNALVNDILSSKVIAYDDQGKCVMQPPPASASAAMAAAAQNKDQAVSVRDAFSKHIIALPEEASEGAPVAQYYTTDTVAASRVDFGEQRVYIIDSPTAHELDDGFSIEDRPDGTWVHVHIADPTAYIPPGSDTALASQLRGNSVYLPERVYSMMPEILSDERFGLEVSPCALTFSARLGADGNIVDYKVQPAIIRRPVVTQYGLVDDVLDWASVPGFNAPRDSLPVWARRYFEVQDENAKAKAQATSPPTHKNPRRVPAVFDDADKAALRRLHEIALRHFSFRKSQGAFVPEQLNSSVSIQPYPLPEWDLWKSGTDAAQGSRNVAPLISLDSYSLSYLSPSHVLVSEMMILAGRVAARFAIDHGVPIPFRGQPSLRAAVSAKTASPLTFQTDLDLVHALLATVDRDFGLMPYASMQRLLPFLPSAQWSLDPISHSLMGLPGIEPRMDGGQAALGGAPPSGMVGYVKATSPLRRYKDMLVHWQFKAVFSARAIAAGTDLSREAAGAAPRLPFTRSQVEALIPHLHASQKSTQDLSKRADRFWTLEWVRRRELLATGHSPALSDAEMDQFALAPGCTDFAEHARRGELGGGTMPAVRGHTIIEPLDVSAMQGQSTASRPVYTAIVMDDVNEQFYGGGSAGRARTMRVAVVELGGIQVGCILDPVSSGARRRGDIVSVVLERVDPNLGRMVMRQVG
nr:hypothetical protein HK105_001586 [Polyrhizophydium stewartii]